MQAPVKGASFELVVCDTSQRGWTQVTLSPEAATAQWRFVSSVVSPDFRVSAGEPLVIPRNARTLA
jgi:alkaline phosphatase D